MPICGRFHRTADTFLIPAFRRGLDDEAVVEEAAAAQVREDGA